MSGIIGECYRQMVERDQRMGRAFPKVPRPTFRRGKDIKELLCRAKLHLKRKVETRREGEERRNGVTRCK